MKRTQKGNGVMITWRVLVSVVVLGMCTATVTAQHPGDQTATVGTPFSLTLEPVDEETGGGIPPYQYNANPLPSGLSFN